MHNKRNIHVKTSKLPSTTLCDHRHDSSGEKGKRVWKANGSNKESIEIKIGTT